MTFDPQWWESRYQAHAAAVHDEPGPHLVADLTGRPPGTALDAGCGRGADAIWLARQGWRVTAVDVSPTAVGDARARAADLAAHVDWVVADLTTWRPPARYDLVVSEYVHPAGPFDAYVARLAGAVAPGGTLLVVGHDHTDPAPDAAAVAVAGVLRALPAEQWSVEVAESRTREAHGRRFDDVVVRARRG